MPVPPDPETQAATRAPLVARDPAIRVVLVTVPDADRAAAVARTLVEEGLIACANIVGSVRSVYRWQSAVQDEPESLMILKCAAGRVDALVARVLALHPYECPEVLCLPVAEGSARYVDWVLSPGT